MVQSFYLDSDGIVYDAVYESVEEFISCYASGMYDDCTLLYYEWEA